MKTPTLLNSKLVLLTTLLLASLAVAISEEPEKEEDEEDFVDFSLGFEAVGRWVGGWF